jgi:F-type H+-transporting ATPase subunit epsilon
MSEKRFVFTLVTPEARLVEPTEVVSVTAFGQEGAFTALPGHTPFLTPLKDGTVVKYRTAGDGGGEYYVDAGFVEVLPDRFSVLAESAVKEAELDRERLAREQSDAARRLEEAKRKAADAQALSGGQRLLEIGELEVKLKRATQRLKHMDKKKRI